MPALAQLRSDPYWFPDVQQASREPNGLLAFGGDLHPARLLAAYRKGIFPWYQAGQPILWWCPDPRAVLAPQRVHVTRSLQKTLRRRPFEVTLDQAFTAVIRACATPTPERPDSWITGNMETAYQTLHELGYAHSVECWQDGHLVGGLYGVAIGRIFFGESMFSRTSDASKVALVNLCTHLHAWGFELIDCQVGNPHTFSMGATEVSRREFLDAVVTLVDAPLPTTGRQWQASLEASG